MRRMMNILLVVGITAVIVNAGHPTLSSGVDFGGNGRDALPDAGAYEWLGDLARLFLPLVVR